jgi:putative nucleotidyltransferase with HDIG domain
MKQIPVSELTPGMVTAQDVFSCDNKLVVPKGVVLTENIISRFDGYSVYYVQIEDGLLEEDFSKPMAAPSSVNHSTLFPNLYSRDYGPSVGLNYDDATVESMNATIEDESFLRFKEGFERCSQHFQDSIMNSLHKNEPFRTNELLRETLSLLNQDGKEINIFDMLLNMSDKEDSVYDHCIGTALTANVLAGWLHFSEADQKMVTACGLFHDVGKLMLPQGIISKPGKLTPSEFEIVKTHTTEGFHLLGKYRTIPEPVKNAALMHHEKCDGSGYPYGLRGNEIDRFSKIVTIADIFNAMTNERVYRSAMCPFSVIKYFEDDGIQKYETKYILTFLENVSNSYLNHQVTLSNGMEGNVIFINREHFSQPIIRTNGNQVINLETQHFNSILQLSANKNLSIEAII